MNFIRIKLLVVAASVFVLVAAFIISSGAQTTATTIQTGTFTLTATNIGSLESLSDAQLKMVLQKLATVPLIWPDALPDGGMSGTYHSLAHPDWPPLPATFGIPVWNLTAGSGSSFYLLDDLDYPEPTNTGGTMQVMDASGFQPLVLTSNDLWLQMLSVTNNTANLVIHPPWNVANGVYDLLYSTNLASPISWQWVLRSDPGQTNLAVANATDAQGFYRLGAPNDLIANDSLGTNFWIAFFGIYPGLSYQLSLYISSPVGATGTVTIPGLGITNAFSISVGATTNMSIPIAAMIADYNTNETNGIHITANQPLSVYGVDYYQEGTAAFTCYPTSLLGTNYCVISRAPSVSASNFQGYDIYSQLAIVAVESNTTVTITPSGTANLEGHTNAYTITNLQPGLTYQVNSLVVYDYTNDITGTLIKSDKPIAVFAGDNVAYVPDTNTESGNLLVQEQLPVEDWGTQALAMGFAGRLNGDTYRVLAAYSNTVVTINGKLMTLESEPQNGPWIVTTTNDTVTTNLMARQYCDIIVDGPVEFQANQPIQVAQFADGSWSDDMVNAQGRVNEGDPCEILLLPTGHYLETNIVVTLTNDPPNYVSGDFDENFLNLVVPQSATNSTRVDGLLVSPTNYVAIGTSGYFGAQVTITNSGPHEITGPQPVGVEVYGWGQWDAYGYFGGIVK